MLNMSFCNGTLNRDIAIEYIQSHNKAIRYTFGLGYRNPTTHKVLISKEKAIEIVKNESLLDIKENEEFIHLNAYHINDMW